MSDDARNKWFRFLSTEEANRTQFALDALSGEEWCKRLVKSFDLTKLQEDFYDPAKQPLMFEVRFAYELHVAGTVPEYEPRLGVGGSSVDFRLPTTPEWRIELWSARLTESNRHSTEACDHGGIITAVSAPDPSEEIRRFQTKIISKVFDSERGRPVKFPEVDGSVHVILVDARGYLQSGGDEYDYREVVYGENGIRDTPWGSTVAGQPLRGMFERGHPNPGAACIRERVHFVGFVVERDFVDREIPDQSIFCANPNLFVSADEANDALEACPLNFSRAPIYILLGSSER